MTPTNAGDSPFDVILTPESKKNQNGNEDDTNNGNANSHLATYTITNDLFVPRKMLSFNFQS